MPKTKFGKWSVGCLGLFFAFLIITQIIVASGQQGGNTIFDNLYISIPMILAGLSGLSAFVFGLVSIIKYKERAALAFLATLIGFLMVAFVAGEFLGPAH